MRKVTALLILIGTLLFSQDKVPNLRLKMLNGKYAKLHDFLKDGPMILDFWATWCEPCKKQMRYLNLFHNHFKEQGLKVLAVNTDSPKSMSKVKPYVRTKGFDFFVAVDPNSQIKKRLKVKEMPTTIIIDMDGIVVHRHKGYVPGDERGVLKEISILLEKLGLKYSNLDLEKFQVDKKEESINVDF